MKPSQSQREDAHLATMFRHGHSDGDHSLTVLARRLTATARLPSYAHAQDAGADLYSDEDCEVYSSTSRRVSTGIVAVIPRGYVGVIKPRSGLAFKHEIDIFGGVIDAGYTGELAVLLANFGPTTFRVRRGDRIAQLVVVPVARCRFVEVGELTATGRGDRGFGSTGVGGSK